MRGVTIPNVLAQRYASAQMAQLWSPEHKVRLERDLWIAVLRAQAELGITVPAGTVEAYEAVRDQVDLASIDAREQTDKGSINQAAVLARRAALVDALYDGTDPQVILAA